MSGVSGFKFDGTTGELVLTDSSGSEVGRHKQIERIESVNPRSYFIVLADNKVAEFSPKDPSSPPQEGCFENKTKTMSMKVIETENPHEYIRHRNLISAQFRKSVRMEMDGMRLACAQIHAKHHYFNPLVLEYSELTDAIRSLAAGHIRPASPEQEHTLIVEVPTSLGGKHWFTVHLSLFDPAQPKILILGGLEEDKLSEIKAILKDTQLYEPDFMIQRSMLGCNFFSMHFAKRLPVLDRYLPKKSDGTPEKLFDYLARNITAETPEIKQSKLPLALTLSAETRKLWTAEIERYTPEERSHPMNKKMEPFDIVISAHKVFSETVSKEQNKLIEHFRAKTLNNTLKFLATTPISRVLELEHQTTLEYLKSQVAAASDSATTSAGAGSSAGSSVTASPAPSHADSPKPSLVFASAHSSLAIPAPLATPATPVPGVSSSH